MEIPNDLELNLRPLIESIGHELCLAIRHGIYGVHASSDEQLCKHSGGPSLESMNDLTNSLCEIASALKEIAKAIQEIDL